MGMTTCLTKTEFMQWYNTVCDGVLDFQFEMRKYGIKDVVLQKACMVYFEAFLGMYQIGHL